MVGGAVGAVEAVGRVGIMGAVGIMGGVGMVPRFVGGGSSQRDSEFLERGLKIEIKNFAKGVAVKLLKPLAKFSNNERENLF